MVQKEVNIAKLTTDLALMDTSKKTEIDVLQRLLEEEKKKADQLHSRLNVYQGDIDAIHSQLHSIEYCDILLTKLKQTVEFVERRRVSNKNIVFYSCWIYRLFLTYRFRSSIINCLKKILLKFAHYAINM